MPRDRGEDGGRRPRVRTPVLLFAAGVVAAGLFVELHAANLVQAAGPGAGGLTESSLGREVAVFSVVSATIFAGFSLVGVAIAARTRNRLLWAMPAVLYVLSPLPGTVLRGGSPVLRPLIDPYTGGGVGIWRFAIADLILVLLPGAVVAARTSRGGRRFDGHATVAFLACAILGALAYLRHQGLATGAFDVNLDAHLPLAVLFVAGAALGTRKPWFPTVHLLLAILFATEAAWFLADWAIGDTYREAASTLEKLDLLGAMFVPPLTAVELGALSDPLARFLRKRRHRRRASETSPLPA